MNSIETFIKNHKVHDVTIPFDKELFRLPKEKLMAFKTSVIRKELLENVDEKNENNLENYAIENEYVDRLRDPKLYSPAVKKLREFAMYGGKYIPTGAIRRGDKWRQFLRKCQKEHSKADQIQQLSRNLQSLGLGKMYVLSFVFIHSKHVFLCI